MPIREWKEGQDVRETLWLVSGIEKRTKDGKPYWEGTFRDATGVIGAKLWDGEGSNGNRVARFGPELEPGPVAVEGRVKGYQGTPGLILSAARAVDRASVDPGNFAPRSARSAEEMLAEFDAAVASVKDPHYRALLEAFGRDEATFGAFRSAPAATVMHHGWVGGLLEHSLALCRNARAIGPNYPGIDVGLLVAGCFFHDAGKAFEISSEPGFEYTEEGKLFGHIYIGSRLAERLMDSIPGFPAGKRRHLLHLILSHQGDRSEGFGSPVDPASPEAILFHQLDNLDAKLQNCLSSLGTASGERPFTEPRGNSMRKSYYRLRPDGAETSGPRPEARKEPNQEPLSEQESPQPGLFGPEGAG